MNACIKVHWKRIQECTEDAFKTQWRVHRKENSRLRSGIKDALKPDWRRIEDAMKSAQKGKFSAKKWHWGRSEDALRTTEECTEDALSTTEECTERKILVKEVALRRKGIRTEDAMKWALKTQWPCSIHSTLLPSVVILDHHKRCGGPNCKIGTKWTTTNDVVGQFKKKCELANFRDHWRWLY